MSDDLCKLSGIHQLNSYILLTHITTLCGIRITVHIYIKPDGKYYKICYVIPFQTKVFQNVINEYEIL